MQSGKDENAEGERVGQSEKLVGSLRVQNKTCNNAIPAQSNEM